MPTQIKPHSLDATRNYTFANTTVNTLTLNNNLVANGGVGSAGQVLTSGSTGNAYWASITVSPTLDNILTNGATSTKTLGVGNTTITGFANVTSTVQVAGITTLNANVVLGTTTITANGGVGSAGAVLTSGGTGNVYWAAASGGGATLSAVAGSTTYYVGLSAATSGTWTDARVDTSNLYYSSGTQTLYATNYNTSSDASLKTNVKTIENALALVNLLRGVGFDWIATGLPSFGVIADELEKHIPDLVTIVNGKRTVNYDAIIGFLIEAIKTQTSQMQSMEERITKLELK